MSAVKSCAGYFRGRHVANRQTSRGYSGRRRRPDRRPHPDGDPAPGAAPQLYSFGDFRLDLQGQTLTRNGDPVTLTSGEFSLLKIFVEHPNHVLSRDTLVDMLSGYERSPFDRSIDVKVTRLRRKIEKDPAAPLFIQTVWGEGYRFSPGAGD